jgi:hypothetical protein
LARAAPVSLLRARDGSVLRWGDADTPAPAAVISPGTPVPLTVAVSPARRGHDVSVEYRVNGGPVRQVTALPASLVHNVNPGLFRAMLPAQPGGLVEFLPVLRFAGQPISPRLADSTERSRYEVGWGATRPQTAVSASSITTPIQRTGFSAAANAELAGAPIWDWNTRFLCSGIVKISKEVIGDCPDGLRINWHVTEGHFVGPGLEGVILPGGGDWMRIRKDGVAIVNVMEVVQVRSGARIFCTYGGLFDLGPDGYARALRGEFDPLPPFMVAPTYTTADKELAWLNRTQCIGVGRVDMNALLAEYDVYALEVGGRKDAK